MLIRIIKFPLKIITFPLAIVLFICHLLCSLFIGISSIATNLLAGVFIIGSVAGWITHAPEHMVWQTAGIGIFLAIFPHAAVWIIGKTADLLYSILGFISA